MEKRAHKFKFHLLELLSIIFLVSFCIQAQSYKSDTTKTDTSKSNTSNIKKDTLGYNNINTPRSDTYSLNNNLNDVNLENSLMTDTTKTDTSWKKPDSLGYNNIKSTEDSYASAEITGSDYYFQYDNSTKDTSETDTTKSDTLGYNENGINNLAINMQLGNNTDLMNSSVTDTTKTDTSWKKPDSLGYNNIKSPDDSYASAEITGSDYYFQYSNSAKDTSETDTTKSDTLGYHKTHGSHYAYNNKEINPASGLNNRSNFLVNPVKDLTQKLKLNVYLMDGQTVKVQEILREYEAETYQSNGNHEELNKAAINALNGIADILTDRQKTEWENAKDEWWISVNKALNLSSISKSKNNLE